MNVTPIVDCRTCEGSGLKAGATRQTCRTCHGSGTQTFVINSGFQMASTCSTCQGTGSTVPPGAHCGSCDGMGKVKERKTVTVDVPSGELILFISIIGNPSVPLCRLFNNRGGRRYDHSRPTGG